MNEKVLKLRKSLKAKLASDRYEHTLSVSFTAMALAMRYGYSLEKAELAGLLHDCAKGFDDATIIEKCRKGKISLTDEELQAPAVLHAKLGAALAEKKYGVSDPEILDAIRYHTTGRAEMTLLDKIIYIADYIEPRRNKAANLDKLRELAFIDLDEALFQIMKGTLEYLEKRAETLILCQKPHIFIIRNNEKLVITQTHKGERHMNESKEMAKIAVEALEDKKGEDIKIINIEGVSVIADYFIIASGTNANQVQAMADNVQEMLYKAGYECRQMEGYQSGNWILLDYNDIIVHIFCTEDRLFYDLERIWRDGKLLSKEEL